MSHNTTRAASGTALACLLLALMAFALTSQAQPEPATKTAATEPAPKPKPTPPPPVPEKLWAQFAAAVRTMPAYKSTETFAGARVREAAKKWQEELKVSLKVETEPFLYWWSLRARPWTAKLSDGTEVRVKVTGRTVAKTRVELRVKHPGRDPISYSLSAPQVALLELEGTRQIVIIDPANVPYGFLSTSGESLASVARKICVAGDLDLTHREDLAGKISLTLSLRNRSPWECLQLAARAAGWGVRCEPAKPAGLYLTSGGRSPIPSALVYCRPDETHRWARESSQSADDALEDLHKEVARVVGVMRKNRPVAVLEPPPEAATAPER